MNVMLGYKNVESASDGSVSVSEEWWHSGLYFGLPIAMSVVQFPLQTLFHKLSSSYIKI